MRLGRPWAKLEGLGLWQINCKKYRGLNLPIPQHYLRLAIDGDSLIPVYIY